MGLRLSRRFRALLGLTAAALSAGCPPVNPPPPGTNPNEAADRLEITELLSEPEVAPFFQSRLINDGVGIFGLGSGALPAELPRRWGRSYPMTVQGGEKAIAEAMALQFAGPAEATGLYQQSQGGKLILDYPWQRKLLSKPFVETSSRQARFVKTAGAWRLSEVSLARLQPKDSALKAGTIVLTVDGQSARRFEADGAVALADLPSVKPDTWAKLEVALSYEGTATDPAFYAFLAVPPMRDRLRLRDDGKDPDAKAGDGVYSAKFLFPGQPGLKHLVIDAIAGKTFADPAMNNYDATQWGLPYRVEGGEGR